MKPLRPLKSARRLLSSCLLLVCPLLLGGCAKKEAAPETIASATDGLPNRLPGLTRLTRFSGCAGIPGPTQTGEPLLADDRNSARLAIRSVERLPEKTLLNLVVYAGAEPVEFSLPLYSLSRGRWLLEEPDPKEQARDNPDRVYLVDQDCREYRLNDVEFQQRRTKPGIIRLAANHAVEGSIRFPPLSPSATFGILIYGRHRIPVVFL